MTSHLDKARRFNRRLKIGGTIGLTISLPSVTLSIISAYTTDNSLFVIASSAFGVLTGQTFALILAGYYGDKSLDRIVDSC